MKPSPKSPSRQSPPPTPEQELIQLRREKDALSQLMWELVRQSHPESHTAEVEASVSDPLWLLAFVPGSAGKTKILAGAYPPITEQQRKRVVRALRGTSKPMEEALRELKLEFPPAYVEKEIAAHLVWDPADKPECSYKAHWKTIRPAGLGERVKNGLNLPK